jgi:hypothetical protein
MVALRVTDDADPAASDTTVRLVLEGVTTFDIDLAYGWNLLAMPFNLPDALPEELFVNDLGEKAFLGTLWQFDTLAGRYSAMTNGLSAKRGFWIYGRSETPQRISFAAEKEADPTLEMAPGWNLLGPVETMAMPTGIWWGWDGSAYFHVAAEHPEADWHLPGKLVEGHAYWYYQTP